MVTNSEGLSKNKIGLIEKIIGAFEIFSIILIPIVFISTFLSLFSLWFLDLEKSLRTVLSNVWVMGVLSIIPAGIFAFLIQVVRLIRRTKRPVGIFNWLALGLGVFIIFMGLILFMGIYAVVG